MKRFGILSYSLVLLSMLLSARGYASRDVVTLDAGNMLLFVSNDGSFAYDPNQTREGNSGLYYPKNSYKWVMSGGGIWVAGKVGDQWRVTISGGGSEFVSGPAYHRRVSVDPFPVYLINRNENHALNDDYRNWPVTLGAPVNAVGQPLISGAQALFTLFNDTDSAAHKFKISGTPPLGVEVKLYAYTYDNIYQTLDTTISQVVFLDYTVTNQSQETIDSCIVSIYADPDLGYEGNDRVGCDSLLSASYCYNETEFDAYYGHHVPVAGVCMLDSRASSINFYYNYFRSDPPGAKLDSLYKTINLVNGLTLTGKKYIDSVTHQPTGFPYNGNPVDGTGWINKLSRDYKTVLNLAPISLGAGDSVRVEAAIIVAQEATVHESIQRFRELTQMVKSIYDADTTKPRINESPLQVVELRGGQLYGKDWGGRYLSGGLDLASRYFGNETTPADLPPVEIRFDSHQTQQAYRFCRDRTGYHYRGMSTSFATVRNYLSQEQYQIAYLDNDCDGSITNASGSLDPLIILSIPYNDMPTAAVANSDISAPATGKLLALQLAATPVELIGRSIVVNCAEMIKPFVAISDTIAIAKDGANSYAEATLSFQNTTHFMQEIHISSANPLRLTATPSHFELGTGESKYVFLHRYSRDSVDAPESITVNTYSFRNSAEVHPVALWHPSQSPIGDINDNSVLDLPDLLQMVKILYRDAPPTVPTPRLDGNCDGVFNLSDLLVFVNALFHQTKVTCGSGEW